MPCAPWSIRGSWIETRGALALAGSGSTACEASASGSPAVLVLRQARSAPGLGSTARPSAGKSVRPWPVAGAPERWRMSEMSGTRPSAMRSTCATIAAEPGA